MVTKDSGIQVNVLEFSELVTETIKHAQRMVEYFRLNSIYYKLITTKGLEFDRIKEFVVGSDPRRIDWKIFSRTGKLMIRAFKEERKFDVIIILDVSNSMLLGTTEYTKNEYGALVAGILAFAASEAGDNVGGGLFSSSKENFIDPEGEFYNLLSILSDKQNYGGKKNWPKLVDDLIANYDDDSIIFIISDFIDSNPETFVPELASNFAQVYGIMITDPTDSELPKGVGNIYLKDPVNNSVVLANLDVLRDEYRLECLENAERLRDTFHKYGQLFFKMDTKEEFSESFLKAVGAEKVI